MINKPYIKDLSPRRTESELALVVGSNVERLRLNARLSKRKFSMMVGVSRPWLIQLEKGLANPRISQLERLAAGLGTTAQDLLVPALEDD